MDFSLQSQFAYFECQIDFCVSRAAGPCLFFGTQFCPGRTGTVFFPIRKLLHCLLTESNWKHRTVSSFLIFFYIQSQISYKVLPLLSLKTFWVCTSLYFYPCYLGWYNHLLDHSNNFLTIASLFLLWILSFFKQKSKCCFDIQIRLYHTSAETL